MEEIFKTQPFKVLKSIILKKFHLDLYILLLDDLSLIIRYFKWK